jgi:hypothetical protein
MLAVKDSRELGRLGAMIFFPLAYCVCMWFLVIQEVFDNQAFWNGRRPTHHQLHVLLFLGIMEYLSLQQVPAGCIYRVQDTESRITHFMYSSRGSKAAYALAGITFDWLERMILYPLLIMLMKICVLGSPGIDLKDLSLALCFSIYDMTKILLNFHTVSYLFDHKESLIKFSGLLSTLFYSFQMSGSMVSFSDFESTKLEMSVISRGSYIRSGFNMLVPLVPDGNPYIDSLKQRNADLHGGALLNFAVMMCHVALAVAVVLVIDFMSLRIKKAGRKSGDGDRRLCRGWRRKGQAGER